MKYLEAEYQKQVVHYIRTYKPNVLFTASIQENANTVQKGVRRKLLGYNSGTPDIQIFEPRGGYHGLFIEMKIKGGTVSPNQKAFIANLEERGYKVVVCFSPRQAIEEIMNYTK